MWMCLCVFVCIKRLVRVNKHRGICAMSESKETQKRRSRMNGMGVRKSVEVHHQEREGIFKLKEET